jgi:4-hydroxybenzoate polyprenyltransferase
LGRPMETPTAPRALSTATRVGFHSGAASALFVTAFQPFLSLIVTGEVRPRATASMFLFVWSMYLADRLKTNPEDELDGDGNAAAFARRHPRFMRLLFVGLLVGQLAFVVTDPGLLVPLALGTLVSLLYLVRLPLIGRRLKEVSYLKCFYLASAALVLVALFTPGLMAVTTPRTVGLLGACFFLYFLNFSLYDIKDVEADRRANIKTLAGAIPATAFLRAQMAASLLTFAVVLWLLPPRSGLVLAGVCLFHAGVSAWLARHRFDGVMCGIVDGGYGAIVTLGTLALLALGGPMNNQ